MRWLPRVLAILAMVGMGPAVHAETWRVALEEIKGSVQHEYAERFAEHVKARSDGKVRVKIFPYGQIGGMKNIYDAVQSGKIHFAFGSGFLGGTVPESQLFSLNYILSDDEWVNARAVNSDAFLKSDAFVSAFRERSLHPLASVIEGWQVWTANKAIRTPEDFQGVGIRTMDNRLLTETYKAYGATPVTIEYGELYSALQMGQAAANIQPVFAHEEMGFYEVQDYMIFAKQAEFIATFMANKGFYDGLSPERQAMIDAITDELVRPIHEHQQALNNQRLDTIKANSDIQIIELNPEERARFEQKSMPVRQTYVDMVGERGRTLLDLLTKEVERVKGQQ